MIAGIFAVQRWSRGSRVRQLLRKWVGVEFSLPEESLRVAAFVRVRKDGVHWLTAKPALPSWWGPCAAHCRWDTGVWVGRLELPD